jgi:protoporphyrin/coproporphyrin ferrochelatase
MADTPSAQPSPTALLLLNLGGPDSLDAVKPFLLNLFSDPLVLDIPFGPFARKLLARYIVWNRLEESKSFYEKIGGRSPIGPLTDQQGEALARELSRRLNRPFRAYPAFRCWHPYIGEALEKAKSDGCRRIVGLSLFPQYHRATTASCILELRQLTDESSDFDVSFIDRFAREGAYHEAVAETVREGLATWPEADRSRVHVLFSAHGAIKSVIDAGDPYQEEIEATVAGIRERVPEVTASTLSYQSRATPSEWLQPYTDKTIQRLGQEGIKDLLVVPISFVSDHVETLYEVDILYAELAKKSGIATFRRVPSLNARPSFVAALTSLVERHLSQVDAVRKEVA